MRPDCGRRFAEADLASILDHHATSRGNQATSRAGEDGSLTQGTAGWAALGGPTGEREAPTGEHPHHQHEREPQDEYEGQRHGVHRQEVAR